MLFFFKSQRACCNSIPNRNSCVLLQTEAADLTWISSQRPVERHTESGWNLQAIGLCACDVLGRKDRVIVVGIYKRLHFVSVMY